MEAAYRRRLPDEDPRGGSLLRLAQAGSGHRCLDPPAVRRSRPPRARAFVTRYISMTVQVRAGAAHRLATRSGDFAWWNQALIRAAGFPSDGVQKLAFP